MLVALSVAAAAVGLAAGYWVYQVQKGAPAARLGDGALARLARGGLGFDALYRGVVVAPSEGLSEGLALVDREVIDRGATGAAATAGLLARAATLLQSGYARAYALAMLVGLLILVAVVAFTGVLS